jgi:DNA-binding transcriptional LysR family regulator
MDDAVRCGGTVVQAVEVIEGAALHLAQPSLSRHIRRLEDQLGARLLDRTPQGSRLTEAGEVFLPRAKALLRSATQAAARTRAAAQPSRITIGYPIAQPTNVDVNELVIRPTAQG